MKPYQFAILQYVHDFSSGERINVGLALWDPEKRSLEFFINHKFQRLSRIYPGFDGATFRTMVYRLREQFDQLKDQMRDRTPSLQRRGASDKIDSISDLLPLLVPFDASCFQWSEVMAGIAVDPAIRFGQLVEELVTQHERRPNTEERRIHPVSDIWDADRIWREVDRTLAESRIAQYIDSDVSIGGARYHYRFRAGWTNGITQVMEPISFDLRDPTDILDTANTWSGRLLTLSRSEDFRFTAIVRGPENTSLREFYDNALAILGEAPNVRQLTDVAELRSVMSLISNDLHRLLD